MKKIFLTVAMFTFFAAGAFAQGISGGIKLGANLSNQDVSSEGFSLETSAKIGIHGGFYLTAMLSDKLGIQPEVLYSAQGSKIDFGGEDVDLNFTYVNVPVLVRYNITEMFNVHLGPQIGFLTKAEIEGGGESEDVKDSFKGTDISAAFGAGVDLPMGLNFGIRYNLGLTGIEEDEEENGSWKNNNLQFYVGYRLFGGN